MVQVQLNCLCTIMWLVSNDWADLFDQIHTQGWLHLLNTACTYYTERHISQLIYVLSYKVIVCIFKCTTPNPTGSNIKTCFGFHMPGPYLSDESYIFIWTLPSMGTGGYCNWKPSVQDFDPRANQIGFSTDQ